MMQTAHFFPEAIDGVEIDTRLSSLGRSYFGLRLSDSMRIYHEDARYFLARNSSSYDVVYVDVYAGGPYIPFHVATVEFYELIRKSISSGGIVAVNLPFYAIGTELSDRLLNTISAVFPATYVAQGMAYRCASEITLDAFKRRLTQEGRSPELERLASKAIEDLRRVTHRPGQEVFSDDHAPIEQMIFDVLRRRADRGRVWND